MNDQLLDTLRIYGLRLTEGQYPEVFGGGDIRFAKHANWEDSHHGQQQQAGSSRSTTGTREWTETRQRTSGEAASIIGEPIELREFYTGQLDEVLEAYPKTEYWELNEGIIMKIQSKILSGLSRTAVFLIRIPFDCKHPVIAWGFWKDRSYQAIGPRHTNFPDASICAFEPTDGTWKHGDSLVELIDLYSLWALRHLHLELLGSWPGHQVTHFPYERIVEINDEEICSCRRPKGVYKHCCKARDQSLKFLPEAIKFITYLAKKGGRKVPSGILPFLSGYPIFNSISHQDLWDQTTPEYFRTGGVENSQVEPG